MILVFIQMIKLTCVLVTDWLSTNLYFATVFKSIKKGRLWNSFSVKFRFSEKLFRQNKWEIFSNFVAFSQWFNFSLPVKIGIWQAQWISSLYTPWFRADRQRYAHGEAQSYWEKFQTESISGRRGLGMFPTRTLKLLVARAVGQEGMKIWRGE